MSVDRGVFAVALIGVVVDLAELGAFHESASHESAGECVHVLIGEGMVLGESDGELADTARFESAYGCSGAFADFIYGETLDFAEADDEQTLCLEVDRGVEEEGLSEGGFELSVSEETSSGAGNCVRGGHQGHQWLSVLTVRDVHREDRQQRCRKSGRIKK